MDLSRFKNEPVGIPLDETLITEQTGFRSTQEMVESFVLAGRRLEDMRHGLNEGTEEVDLDGPTVNHYETDPVDVGLQFEKFVRNGDAGVDTDGAESSDEGVSVDEGSVVENPKKEEVVDV